MSYNLIKQLKTHSGLINCYVIDEFEELQTFKQLEDEIIGCRVFCISNGKFYVMDSDKIFHEQNDFSTPELQKIEDEITENGEYEYTYDEKNYDGIDKVTIQVAIEGNGNKVAVNAEDKNPDYLANKLVEKAGGGVEMKILDNDKLELSVNMKDYEIDYLETLPLVSLQSSFTPTYSQTNITFLGTMLTPSSSFSFIEGQSLFECYSDSGDMSNCRFVLFSIDEENNSAKIIAYSDIFDTRSARNNNKISVKCAWFSGEKIKGGSKYYIGIAGNVNSQSFMKMFGYIAWAAQDLSINPPFNVYLSTTSLNINNLKNVIVPLSNFTSNGAFYCYFGVIH